MWKFIVKDQFSGKKIDISEAEKRFKEEFEKAEQSDDPLDICIKFIAWFEEYFPTGEQIEALKYYESTY